MDTFVFPVMECATATPEFSQETAILSCRTVAAPIATKCSWNADLSSQFKLPLYSCSSTVTGVLTPTLMQEYPACFMAAARDGQTIQFACPRSQ